MRVSACASRLGPWRAGPIAILVATLSACGGSPASIVVNPVGTTAGVTLSSSTNSQQIQQGDSMVLSAVVTVDPNNEGVTWKLTGDGKLSNITTTAVTYTAPSGFDGTKTPIVKATSVADTTKTAAATLVVLGLPTIATTILFPGNVDSAYGAGIAVSGGLAPFTWVVSSGTLPPGITLGTTATTAVNSISGKPTTVGSYDFQIKATDKNGNFAKVNLTLIINPAAACLLNGRYALLYTGYSGSNGAVGAASLQVSSNGSISGYQDFSAAGTPIAETITGKCTTRTANNGTLAVIGVASSPVYDYAVAADLKTGRVHLLSGGDSQSGTGFILQQDPKAFDLPLLAGDFAFGVQGTDASGTHMGLAGTVSIDAGGVVTAGRADANGSQALTAAPLTGTVSSPDENGRGTLALANGNTKYNFTYYIVDTDRLLLTSAESSASAPRLAGLMTRSSGTFDGSSLSGSSILTLWNHVIALAPPKTILTVGRLSNANASSGTVAMTIDRADRATAIVGKTLSNVTYSVASDGRTIVTYSDSAGTHSLALYLDGPGNGYVVELGSSAGGAGLLEAQMSGPYSNTVPGLFVGGTQFPQDVAPLVLLPAVRVAAGSVAASNANGFFALDESTGRGVGTFSVSGSSATTFVIYIVNPHKMVTMRFGSKYFNGVTDWLSN